RKIEPNETKEKTDLPQLEEHIAYPTKPLQYITSFYTTPGLANEVIHLYYTDALEEMQQKVDMHEDEFLEIKTLSLKEAEEYMQKTPANDIKTMYALLYFKQLGFDPSC